MGAAHDSGGAGQGGGDAAKNEEGVYGKERLLLWLPWGEQAREEKEN